MTRTLILVSAGSCVGKEQKEAESFSLSWTDRGLSGAVVQREEEAIVVGQYF